MRSLLIAALACWPATRLPVQDPAPAVVKDFRFAARTIGGQSLEQSDFQENVLIVDLWGTWCPPCREAVPMLVHLYEQYKHQGLEVVGFCYARDGAAEAVDLVRKFAVENRVTYPLLPGSDEVRSQVPSFEGYPTMLLFQRGLVHERTVVGFDGNKGKDLEKWVQQALGIEAKPAAGEGDEAAETVPPGRIFEPGNGDHGFEFAGQDVHGREISFAKLQGHAVLLALTTTWDQEALRTARMLEDIRRTNPDLQVVAWHFEQGRDPEAKAAAVRAFTAQHGLGYRSMVSDLALARQKVHRFASMPTMLLFDAQGVLVHRAGGASVEIEQRLRAEIAKLRNADK